MLTVLMSREQYLEMMEAITNAAGGMQEFRAICNRATAIVEHGGNGHNAAQVCVILQELKTAATRMLATAEQFRARCVVDQGQPAGEETLADV